MIIWLGYQMEYNEKLEAIQLILHNIMDKNWQEIYFDRERT